MSGMTNPQSEDDKKPNDRSAHINLKVKGQPEMKGGDVIDAVLPQNDGVIRRMLQAMHLV
ncbi:small ubiquitin-related modifier 1 [Tripterygium wilfordii]|uniref:Small ubiquitin-related modifier 1 n=1 Tax=Tripterygium wilfordii TaxID=458696 RepID=A0A7J7BX70_TRIWF|nr:small ubiquitin-related modifier 1 [Tripterygium wilfordii]